MNVTEYAEQDATGLAELIRGGEVTPEEVHAAAVEAVEAVNAEINAVADGPWERPLDYAAGGPFAGVPYAIKDLGGIAAGVRVRSGTRLSGAGVPVEHDSYLIGKFRQAGFAGIALTTTPELGFNANTEAVLYGSTRNPWDLDRSVGGSSGGSAALVAAGGVPVAHGGDGGGSLRLPAACNGIVGLRPSRGRTSLGPDCQEALSGLGIEFALMRTMRDCAALLDVLSGPMPGDRYVIKEPLRPWSQELGADPGTLRIALHAESWSDVPVDPEVAAAVEAVGRRLEQLGHRVERATPSFDWEAFVTTMTTVATASVAEVVEDIAAASGMRPGPDTLEATIRTFYEHGRGLTVLEMAQATKHMNAVMRMVGTFFTQWDLLITPTMNTLAPPLGYHDANDPSYDPEGWTRRVFGVCSFTPLFNWAGTPAISLPLGFSSAGLPIGVQLVAPMCDEARLIQLGSLLEEATPWASRRPRVHAANSSGASSHI
jgi:amidase